MSDINALLDDDPGIDAADRAARPAGDPTEVAQARDALTAAQTSHDHATAQRDGARDALADAEGALRVTTVKVEDYEQDDSKKPWQHASAAESVEKARRAIDHRDATARDRERQLEETAAAVERADENLTMALATAARVNDAAEDAPPTNYYPNVYVFVPEFLATIYARTITRQSKIRWCARWWMHPEAVARLDGLWKAFEALRVDPGTGTSLWWRDHADPCMAHLTSSDGPFQRCNGEDHFPVDALPSELAPAWLLKSDGATL
ncbi:DUF4913 domain-containing protein [Pengzhenrongella sp.]|jgi:hypothetical protein|uniref:DUF4913 domain-containing protein n=1 Tax=Pengzhenrongella sp. TaxID=2888820 RepID=UPI002F95E0E4